MDFELIISGLCIIALKSPDRRPEHPEAVDIICPNAMMHAARLGYPPTNVQAFVTPEMVIDNTGGRFSSLDVGGGSIFELSFKQSPYTEFTLKWEGDPNAEEPGSEKSMNWVPTLGHLGFDDFKMAKAGKLPPGAATRFTLPYGELVCRDVVRHVDGTYARWNFPAAEGGAGHKRAVANFVVYSAKNVGNLLIKRDGEDILSSGAGSLTMCLSNDMEYVPMDFNSPVKALDHLAHLDAITFGDFKVPTLVDLVKPVRTGHPICNQVIFNYNG